MRKIRSLSRASVLATIAAVLTPVAIVGGLAYANASDTPDSGQMTLTPGGSATSGAVGTFADGKGAVSFDLPGRPTGDSVYVGVNMRRTVAGSLYRPYAQVAPDGSVTVGIGKVVARGAEQLLATKRLSIKVGTGSTSLNVQGIVYGNGVGMRAWLAGTTQPSWQLVVNDNAAITGSGSTQAWAYLSARATTGISFGYHDLSGTSAGPITVPTPAPTTPVSTAPTPTGTSTATSTVVPTTTAPASPAPTTSTTAPTAPNSPTVASVLAASGARLPINLPVPAGAVVIGPGDSITAAVAQVPSGGTLVLHGGTYRQTVPNVNKSITIQAYPGETPVLSGLDVVSAWTASGGAWRATSWTSPFGQNQYMPGQVAAGSAAGQVEQTYRNGAPLTQVMSRSQLTSGTFWIDPSSHQLWVGDDPSGATMEVSNRDRAMTLNAGATGSKLIGLRFTGYAAPHLDNGAELYVGSSNTLIQDDQFDHSSGAGVKIANSSIQVEHNTISDNGAEGLTGNRNDNSVVSNNAFLRNNASGFVTVGCGAYCTVAGFKAAHTANLSVLDNAFVGNNSNGFWCDLGCTNATISGNAVSGGQAGLYYEVSSVAKIVNNYVEKAVTGVRVSGSDHVTVSGNTLVDNQWQLTIYDDTRSPSSDAYSASLGLTWNTTNLVIGDNTFTGGSSTAMLLAANATSQVASPQMYSKVSDNNVAGNQNMVWCQTASSCKSYPSVDAWKAASGLNFGS